MATDQVTGAVGGATGTPLSGITGSLQGTANNMLRSGKNQFDKILPPQRREELKSKIAKFSTERPLVASFILSQIALNGVPLTLFFVMTVSVGISALVAGLIVGLVGVLLFIIGALLVALFIVLPTLVIATFLAFGLWLWVVGAYYLIKWFNQKKIPGIHMPLGEGLLEQTGLNHSSISMGETPHQPTGNGNGVSNGNTKDIQHTSGNPNQHAKKSTLNSSNPPGKHEHNVKHDGTQQGQQHTKNTTRPEQTPVAKSNDTKTTIHTTADGIDKQLPL